MSNPDNNAPVQETLTVDGGELTAEEQSLIAKGLNEERDEAAEAEAAEKAEAERLAAEKAQEEADAAAAAEAERKAAEAAAQATVPAAVPFIPEPIEKPAAPKDFEAEFAALDKKLQEAQDQFDAGTIEAEDLARITRETNAAIRVNIRDEARYETQVANWEATEQARTRAIEDAQQRSEKDWNAAALSWEQDNADFMANPLRAKAMQEAIAAVDAAAQKESRALTPQQLLAEAGRIAKEAFGYAAPAQPNQQQEVRRAIGERAAAAPGPTLGDAPTAGNEPIRGNEAFSRLDDLPIEDLEATTANMSAAELERFLRDAPGANANGRE